MYEREGGREEIVRTKEGTCSRSVGKRESGLEESGGMLETHWSGLEWVGLARALIGRKGGLIPDVREEDQEGAGLNERLIVEKMYWKWRTKDVRCRG